MKLSAGTSHKLLNPAVTQADDCSDVAVAESGCVGLADGCVALLAGRLIPGDGAGERSLVVGHVKKCTGNLTAVKEPYSFLYMENARYIVQRGAIGFHIIDTQTGEDLGAFHARWKAEAKAAELNG